MRGKILAASGLVLAVLSLLFFVYLSHTSVPRVPILPHKSPIHFASDRNVSLQNVAAKVIYFVPADMTTNTVWDWKKDVDTTMQEERRFFSNQLGNTLQPAIYPQVVVGKNPHDYYDGDKTDHGNPHALVAIRDELLDRVYSSAGDLYDPEFVKADSSAYQILIIIYEGTGASSIIYQNGDTTGEDVIKIEKDGPPAIILSTAFLNSPYYKEFGSTILAHEIAHSFGLNDGYDLSSGTNQTDDLMGEGRRRVLTATYISEKNKRLLGATP